MTSEMTMTDRLRSPRQWLRWIGSNTRRLAILVAGSALVGAGIAMLVLPGPGIVVSFAGLAVLATEFAWAERALDRSKTRAIDATNLLTSTATGRLGLAASATALVVGGVISFFVFSGYRAIGVGAIVAGVGAAIVLVPATQRWLTRTSAPSETSASDTERLRT